MDKNQNSQKILMTAPCMELQWNLWKDIWDMWKRLIAYTGLNNWLIGLRTVIEQQIFVKARHVEF
jgi:hypothetical protein